MGEADGVEKERRRKKAQDGSEKGGMENEG